MLVLWLAGEDKGHYAVCRVEEGITIQYPIDPTTAQYCSCGDAQMNAHNIPFGLNISEGRRSAHGLGWGLEEVVGTSIPLPVLGQEKGMAPHSGHLELMCSAG